MPNCQETCSVLYWQTSTCYRNILLHMFNWSPSFEPAGSLLLIFTFLFGKGWEEVSVPWYTHEVYRTTCRFFLHHMVSGGWTQVIRFGTKPYLLSHLTSLRSQSHTALFCHSQWLMYVIPAFGKLSQEDCYTCKVSLGYLMRHCLKQPKTNHYHQWQQQQ